MVSTHNRRISTAAANLAMLVGLLYASISAYWGLGGTRLLDTVGGQFERLGRSGGANVALLLGFVVLLKVVAAVLPLLAIRSGMPPPVRRVVRSVTWIAGLILAGYGLIFTGVGLLVQAGAIATPADADQRALAWHAYLWDPWFLVWGAMVIVALLASRRYARCQDV